MRASATRAIAPRARAPGYGRLHKPNPLVRRRGPKPEWKGAAGAQGRFCPPGDKVKRLHAQTATIENGFVFNTNCFHEELPFLWEKDGKLLVELPRQPFGDGTLFGHRHGEYGNPFHGLETWKAYFDELYAESSAERPKYIPFTMHPYIIGRPGRTLALRGIIQHMKKAGNLWFPTGIELAEWCLDNVFQAECRKLRAAAG